MPFEIDKSVKLGVVMPDDEIVARFYDPTDKTEFTIQTLCRVGALNESEMKREAMMEGLPWEYYSQMRISSK